MAKHALLSASSASRWLNCTPSAVLESKVANVTSSYADEGTVAHSLAELELRRQFNLITELEYQKELSDIEQSDYYNDAMADYINSYVVFIVERYNTHKNAAIFLEQHLDLTLYIPFGFGTSDVNIVADTILEVIDLKYGQGLAVSAEDNSQMKVYALGAYNEFAYMSSIKIIRLTIYQPRIGNFSTFEISTKELLKWADNELKPKAEIAYKGEGDLSAGSWCKFCKVKATCRAFATAQLELAKVEFSDLEKDEPVAYDKMKLSDHEISKILLKSSEFKSWINAVEDYALQKALKENKKWPDMKLVTGRSVRKYSDDEKIISLLQKKKYAYEDITQSKIIPITKMEKLLGKTIFEKLLNKYIIKPVGSLTLVHVSDKRLEYNSAEAAKNDFVN